MVLRLVLVLRAEKEVTVLSPAKAYPWAAVRHMSRFAAKSAGCLLDGISAMLYGVSSCGQAGAAPSPLPPEKRDSSKDNISTVSFMPPKVAKKRSEDTHFGGFVDHIRHIAHFHLGIYALAVCVDGVDA